MNWKETALSTLRDPAIPDKDKIRAICQQGILPETLRMKLFLRWASQVRHLMHDGRSTNALNVLERYIVGEATKEELKNAEAEAWDAWWSAGEGADGARTAWVALVAARPAWMGARPAWAESGYDATFIAAEVSALKSARSKQVQIAIEEIEKYE